MRGGGKGLLENSTNLCASPHRATADFTGHNGKLDDFRPLLAVSCGKQGKIEAEAPRQALIPGD
jgi:hypothetical protein